MAHQKMYKDQGLNDTITVEIPIHLALQATAEYMTFSCSAMAMNTLMRKIQEEIMDPIWVREREAEHQGQHDQAQMAWDHFWGRRPDIPPTMEQPE